VTIRVPDGSAWLAGLAEELVRGGAPGAVVGLARGGEAVFGCAGLAQRAPAAVAGAPATRGPTAASPAMPATGVPMTVDAATDAGSVTKVLATTAALMALVDSGEIDLEQRAERFLGPLAAASATLADLAWHRAGLWEWWPLYLRGRRGPDASALARALELRHAPGAARHYSDLGFILLGEVVSKVTGAPLAEAVSRLVSTPFGLTHTQYATPVGDGPVIASSPGDRIEQQMIRTGAPYPVTGSVADFDRWREHTLIGEVNDGNAFHAFGGTSGHAGLFTTAADLTAFGAGLLASLAGAGPIRAATARRFVAPGPDPAQGLGFRIWPHPAGPAIGHPGFPGVAFAILPEQAATVVMITNRLHADGAPPPTEPMWQLVLRAAREQLARDGSRPNESPKE